MADGSGIAAEMFQMASAVLAAALHAWAVNFHPEQDHSQMVAELLDFQCIADSHHRPIRVAFCFI